MLSILVDSSMPLPHLSSLTKREEPAIEERPVEQVSALSTHYVDLRPRPHLLIFISIFS